MTTSEAEPKLTAFVSYSRDEIEFVDRLQSALAVRRIGLTVDRTEIAKGEDWWVRLEGLIDQADTVIVVLSPGFLASKTCLREVEQAASKNKRMIPIVAGAVGGLAIPEAIARLNYLYFVENKRVGAIGHFDTAVEELARTLETDIAWIREHTRYGHLADTWARRGKSAHDTLRGDALSRAQAWVNLRPAGAPELTPEIRTFLDESRRTFEAEETAKQANIDRILIGQSRFLAGAARTALDDGDAATAALLALEGLPDLGNPALRPLVIEVQAVLCQSLLDLREAAVATGVLSDLVGPRGQMAVSPDGCSLAVACEDHSVHVWQNLPLWNPAVRIALPGPVEALGFAGADGRLLIATMDSIFSWNADRADKVDLVWTWGYDGSRQDAAPIFVRAALCFSADGRRAIRANDLALHCIDIKSDSVICSFDRHGPHAPVTFAALSPDGTVAATSSPMAERLLFWCASTGEQIAEVSGHVAAFAPVGKHIAFASYKDKTVRLLDAETFAEPALPAIRHTHDVNEFRFLSDGKSLATAAADDTIRIWTVGHAEPALRLKGHVGKISAVAVSPNGENLFSASHDATVRRWRLTNNERITVVPTDSGHTAVKPDGHQLPLICPRGRHRIEEVEEVVRKTLTVYDTSSNAVVGRLTIPDGRIEFAAFSNDGELLVVTSSDLVAYVWRIGTAEPIAVLRGDDPVIWMQRTANAPRNLLAMMDSAAAFSKNGTQVVTALKDRCAILWDVGSGKRLAVLGGHPDHVTEAFFKPMNEPSQDPVIVTRCGYQERTWKLFRSTSHMISYARETIPRGLTRRQRDQAYLEPASPDWMANLHKWPPNEV